MPKILLSICINLCLEVTLTRLPTDLVQDYLFLIWKLRNLIMTIQIKRWFICINFLCLVLYLNFLFLFQQSLMRTFQNLISTVTYTFFLSILVYPRRNSLSHSIIYLHAFVLDKSYNRFLNQQPEWLYLLSFLLWYGFCLPKSNRQMQLLNLLIDIFWWSFQIIYNSQWLNQLLCWTKQWLY